MNRLQLELKDSLNLKCAGQRYWYVFFLSSLVTFIGGLGVILLFRLVNRLFLLSFKRLPYYFYGKSVSAHFFKKCTNI